MEGEESVLVRPLGGQGGPLGVGGGEGMVGAAFNGEETGPWRL